MVVPPALRIEAPGGLLARGAFGPPSEIWRQIHPALRGKARALPSTPELAVTTLAGFSPLVAGLVDASAPMPFDVVDMGASGIGAVVGVRLRSSSELVVAVSSGGDAKFTAEMDRARGATLLRPKDPRDVAVAVAGDYLLFGATVEALREAGAHVAQAPAPAVPAGCWLVLSATRTELAGPVSAAVTRYGGALRRGLETADVENRVARGGRAPDFADPEPIVVALKELADSIVAVLSSTSVVRADAAMRGERLVLHVEAEPAEAGAAHDFASSLPHGDLAPLLALPEDVRGAIFWRRAPESGALPIVDRFRSLFGERLTAADLARFRRFGGDLDRALGHAVVAGFYGNDRSTGAFLETNDGDGPALGHATSELVDVYRIRAIRQPFETFAGRLSLSASGASVGDPAGTRLTIGLTSPGERAPTKSSAVSVSNANRGAFVVGGGDVSAYAEGLVHAAARSTFGADAVLADVARRAQHDAVLAGVVRLRDSGDGKGSLATLAVGESGKLLWAELETSAAAMEPLLESVAASTP